MDLLEHERHAGQRHPWERARAVFFERVLRRHRVHAARVLDAGAGDGWTAGGLRPICGAREVVCWDIMYSNAQIAEFAGSQPGLEFTRELPEGPFDLALMLDVLEHVPDDAEFLHSVAQRLDRSGTLLVSVPAWPALFASHDVFLKHHRRYRPQDAARLLQEGGFEIIESGGLFHGLLPVRASQVAWERLTRSDSSGLSDTPQGRLNEWMTRALVAEQRISLAGSRAGLNLPGLSWWCIARRR